MEQQKKIVFSRSARQRYIAVLGDTKYLLAKTSPHSWYLYSSRYGGSLEQDWTAVHVLQASGVVPVGRTLKVAQQNAVNFLLHGTSPEDDGWVREGARELSRSERRRIFGSTLDLD